MAVKPGVDQFQTGRWIRFRAAEADIYLYMAHKREHNERFIVRAAWNRNVKHDNEAEHLYEVMKASPVKGTAQVEIPQRGGRRARKATLQLKSTTVELTRPKPLQAKYPARVSINVLFAEEIEPPRKEEPLSWMLLTTESVDGLNDMKTVLNYYRLRWRIEVFHKAWKSGAGVERQRMQTADNLERIAVVLAFVAIRLLQLRELFESDADVKVDQILDAEMWKLLWVSVEKNKPPRKAPAAGWAYHALGRLGGWTNTKGSGKVGWDTLWTGWNRLQERYEGFEAHKLLTTFR